jgi:hypothetical protein
MGQKKMSLRAAKNRARNDIEGILLQFSVC